jgi:biofilm PGA synthesis protein PgaA
MFIKRIIVKTKGYGIFSILLFLLSILFIVGHVPVFGAEESSHRQAITLARQGNYEQSLVILRQLLEEEPGRQTLVYDLMTVLSWAGQDEEVLRRFQSIKDEPVIPVYVLAAVAQSARRQRRLVMSRQLCQSILEQQPHHFQARVGLALVMADEGKKTEAFKSLKALAEEKPLDPGLLSAYAYVAQLNKDPYTEMACYLKLLERDPGNKKIKTSLLRVASSVGAPNVALDMLEQDRDLTLPTEIYETIKGDHAAQVVGWGDLTPVPESARFREIDRAKQMFDDNISRIEADPSISRRFLHRAHFDSFFALEARGRMKEILNTYLFLRAGGGGVVFPSYALRLVGDAYLYLLKPRKARDLYIEALNKWFHNFPAAFSLFYGYLESESYGASGRHIRETARRQPVWLQAPGSPVLGENPKRLAADIAAILFHAYSRRLRRAYKMIEAKLDIAPASRDVRSQFAKICLWRGWIRKALKQLRLVLVQEPENLEARIWYRQALIYYHKYNLARRGMDELLKLFPEVQPVQKLKRDWNTQHMWYLHSELLGQEGEGVIVGKRDFSSDSWLYTPPMGGLFKGFFHHYSRYGRFDDISVRDDWFGAGFDYTYGDFSGQLEILRRLTDNPDYGYRLFGRWNMNDYWEVSAEYNGNGMDVPLKGRIVDLKGNRTRFSLAWRLSDLTYFSGTLTFYDYNDGNRRQSFLLYAYRKLYASPYHWLTAELEFYTSGSRPMDQYYYNPESDVSYLFILDFWQIIFRKYDFKFAHRMVVSYGGYWQKYYGAGWIGAIRYEHHWDIDDRRAFLYGIGYYRRVYDGRPESGYNIYATINWRF